MRLAASRSARDSVDSVTLRRLKQVEASKAAAVDGKGRCQVGEGTCIMMMFVPQRLMPCDS